MKIILAIFFPMAFSIDEHLFVQILKDNSFREIPEMKSRQENCLKIIKNGGGGLDLPTCVIKGSGDGRVLPLTEEKIGELAKKLKTPTGPQFEGKALFPTEQRYDRAMRKLGDYYFEQLNQNLYGKAQENDPLAWSKRKYVEHSTFYEIYKNQVSKNLIETLSSYCIEADKERFYLIPIKRAEREKIRETNIKNLEIIFDEGQKAESLAFKDWNSCMQGIQHICYKTTYINKKGELIADYAQELKVPKLDWEYSKKRACIVMNYVKAARQTLLKVTEIQKLMNYVDGSANNKVDWFKGIAGIEMFNEKDMPIDSLTGIVSSDIKLSGMEKENEKLVESLKDKCIKNIDIEKCQKLLTNEEWSNDLATEIALKTTAMLDRIEKMDESELRTYLTEQGYSSEKIKELEDFKADLKKEIIDRYSIDQQALIDDLAEKIESKSIQKIPPLKQKEKIEKIIEELTARPKEFKQLIHFNNVISGYLTVTSDGNKSKNFQSIFRELGGIDKNESEDKDHIKRLKEKLAMHSIFAPTEKRKIEGVTVEALNSAVLKYQTEKLIEKPMETWNEQDEKYINAL